jgi:hypothetical protein
MREAKRKHGVWNWRPYQNFCDPAASCAWLRFVGPRIERLDLSSLK